MDKLSVSSEEGIWSYSDFSSEDEHAGASGWVLDDWAADKEVAQWTTGTALDPDLVDTDLGSNIRRAVRRSQAGSPQTTQGQGWPERVFSHFSQRGEDEELKDVPEGRRLLVCSGDEAGRGCFKAHLVACDLLVEGGCVGVAWKAVANYPDTERGRKDFERDLATIEVFAKRGVRHPNLLQYELRSLGKLPVLCAELAEMDLAKALCLFKLSTLSQVNVLIGTARAVHRLHQAKLFHGDIKLDNVLVCRQGLSQQVKDPGLDVRDVRLADIGTVIRIGMDAPVYLPQEPSFLGPQKQWNFYLRGLLHGGPERMGLLEFLRARLKRLEAEAQQQGESSSTDSLDGALWYQYPLAAIDAQFCELERLQEVLSVLGDTQGRQRIDALYSALTNDPACVCCQEQAEQELAVFDDVEALKALLGRLEDAERDLLAPVGQQRLAAADAYSLGILCGAVLGTGIPQANLEVHRLQTKRLRRQGKLRDLDRVMLACSDLAKTQAHGSAAQEAHALVRGLCDRNIEQRLSVGEALFRLIQLRVLIQRNRQD